MPSTSGNLPFFLMLIPIVPSLWVCEPLTAPLTVLLDYGSFRFVENAHPPLGL